MGDREDVPTALAIEVLARAQAYGLSAAFARLASMGAISHAQASEVLHHVAGCVEHMQFDDDRAAVVLSNISEPIRGYADAIAANSVPGLRVIEGGLSKED